MLPSIERDREQRGIMADPSMVLPYPIARCMLYRTASCRSAARSSPCGSVAARRASAGSPLRRPTGRATGEHPSSSRAERCMPDATQTHISSGLQGHMATISHRSVWVNTHQSVVNARLKLHTMLLGTQVTQECSKILVSSHTAR